MQTIKVTESCGCGAVCIVEYWQVSVVRPTLAEFRIAHMACRPQEAETEHV